MPTYHINQDHFNQVIKLVHCTLTTLAYQIVEYQVISWIIPNTKLMYQFSSVDWEYTKVHLGSKITWFSEFVYQCYWVICYLQFFLFLSKSPYPNENILFLEKQLLDIILMPRCLNNIVCSKFELVTSNLTS